MSVTLFPEQSCFYLAFNTIFIMADHPKAIETMDRCPDVPAVNRATLDLICDLTQSKASAEAKLMLLKKAIESL